MANQILKGRVALVTGGSTGEIPAGRVGTAQDIGDALVFLASDASSYIRGIDLVVDGGMTRVYAGKN